LAAADALQNRWPMKTFMTLFAITFTSACAVDSDGVATTSQAVTSIWRCEQQCGDGQWSVGFGSTPDTAYQDLPGCGPGGGDINCNFIVKPEILN
jgi:hypothetical protein